MPEPCSPTTMILTGGLTLRSSSLALPPITSRSSVATKLDQVLLGRQRAQHFLAERLAFDVLDEVADDLDIDVGFEQREPDLAQRLFDIALGDPALAP